MQGLNIDVRHDLAALKRDLSRMQRQAIPKAARAALNRTAASLRGTAVKAIAAESGIKQKDVRAGLRLRKAIAARLEARIEARGRPLNLIRFNARQAKRWVSARPWRKLRKYRGRVFIGNAGRTVFIREGQGHAARIRGMYGPGIAPELIRKAVTQAVDAQFDKRWPVELDRALRNELRKLGFR